MDSTSQQLDQRFDRDRIAASETPTTQVEECSARLAALTARMSTFLKAQIDSLQAAAKEVESASELQAKYEAMTLELAEQQQEWERHKEAEALRMAADARLLSEAWDEIENERRERLSQGSPAGGHQVEYSMPEVSDPAPPTSQSMSDTALFDLGMPKSAQPSSVQFQQLKREIRQHARRNR